MIVQQFGTSNLILILLILDLCCSFVCGRGRGGGRGRGSGISKGGGPVGASTGSSSEWGIVYFFGSGVLILIIGCIVSSCLYLCKKRKPSSKMKSRLKTVQRNYTSPTALNLVNNLTISQTVEQKQRQRDNQERNKAQGEKRNQQEQHEYQIHVSPVFERSSNPEIWTCDLPVNAPLGYQNRQTVNGTTALSPPEYSTVIPYQTWKARKPQYTDTSKPLSTE